MVQDRRMVKRWWRNRWSRDWQCLLFS